MPSIRITLPALLALVLTLSLPFDLPAHASTTLPTDSTTLPADSIAQRRQRVATAAEQWPRPDDLAFAAALSRTYAANFGQIDRAPQLPRLDDAGLKLLWEAVSTTAFYSDDRDVLDAALRVHAELAQRGLADAAVSARLFRYLLAARRFAAAQALADAHPGQPFPALPDFIDSPTTLPSVWRLDASGRTARRIGLDLGPLQILVVSGCHFSADAADDIAADPVLGSIFAQHARWLALSPGAENLDALAEWNRRHPQTPLLPIYARSEWALIPQWTMPTFAIVENGKVIESVKGWKSDDPTFRQQLVAMLQRVGLLQADAPLH